MIKFQPKTSDMKKKLRVLVIIILTLIPISSVLSQEVKRVEPTFWWTGMKNPELQLLIYGDNIGQLSPSLDYKGVKLRSTIKVKNPNYLFVNLTITNNAKPGKFEIQFKDEKEALISYPYEIKERKKGSAERKGFDNSDVIYLITPDRFANGNPGNDNIKGLKEKVNRDHPGGRHGGDIQGIIDHLNYLEEMGFTGIWLNPILENDHESYSYHGYSTTDYYKIDPRFGSNELYKELSKKAHEKGMKLIMDMIPNHCGSEHWWIKDPPTDNWVHYQNNYTNTNHRRTTLWDPYASKIDRRQFEDGWFVKSMPDLNQDNPLMSNYLIQNAIWWIEYAGLRGIRVDTYPYSGREFMSKWTCRVMEEYPGMNIVGEEWTDNPAITSSWQRGKEDQHTDYRSCLPALMDFPTQIALPKALTEEEGWDKGWIKLYRSLANDFLYPDPDKLVIFADNHDMSRFYTQVNEDFDLFKMGLVFIATTRGIPQIFYGTEILKSNPDSDDHGVIRSDFPGGWANDNKNGFTGKGLSEKELKAQSFLKKLLNWRKEEEVIHSGKLKHYLPQNGLYVYFRYNEEKTIMVALNKNKDEAQKIDTERFSESIKGLSSGINIITGKKISNLSDFKIKPKSAAIIVLQNKNQ